MEKWADRLNKQRSANFRRALFLYKTRNLYALCALYSSIDASVDKFSDIVIRDLGRAGRVAKLEAGAESHHLMLDLADGERGDARRRRAHLV